MSEIRPGRDVRAGSERRGRGASRVKVAPCVGAVHRRCLYVVGGGLSGQLEETTYDTWMYDWTTGQWTHWLSMPGNPANYGFILGGGTGCNGKIYIGGDYRGIHDFFAFDPATATWTQLASIPAAGAMCPAMICQPSDNAVYLPGSDPDSYWGTYNRTAFRYDIAANIWSGPLPHLLATSVLGLCGYYMDDKLWTFGGTQGAYALTAPPHESLRQIHCPPCIVCWTHLFRTKMNWAYAARPGWKGPWGPPGIYGFQVDDIQYDNCAYDPAANENPAYREVIIPAQPPE